MVDYQYKLEFGFETLKSGVKPKYSTRNFDDESWMLTGDLKIAEVRWVVQYKIKDAAEYLKGEKLDISVNLNIGKLNFTAYTMDLTKRYIEINADYRT